MPNENFILDTDPFANKSVPRNLEPPPHRRPFLNLDECPHLRVIPHFTSIKIGESENSNILTKLHIRRDLLMQNRRGRQLLNRLLASNRQIPACRAYSSI